MSDIPKAKAGNFLFTSESVNEGHPGMYNFKSVFLFYNLTFFIFLNIDKICDQVSDAVLDACLRGDPTSKVACETCTKTGMIMIFGEITTKVNNISHNIFLIYLLYKLYIYIYIYIYTTYIHIYIYIYI